MKKFLIISDTHGDLYVIRQVIKKHPDINAVIHLGDYCRDVKIIKTEFTNINFFSVMGNCDFSLNVPEERTLEIEGKRVFITHGHHFNVKNGTHRLEAKAAKDNLDAVLFGHTHEPFLKRARSALILNPGSLGYPRGSAGPTYAILEVGKDKVDASILAANEKPANGTPTGTVPSGGKPDAPTAANGDGS